jgi:protoheme IX farnesyltransferase
MKTVELPLTTMPLAQVPALPEPLAIARSRCADFVQLMKPRLTLMVLLTVAAGFVMGTGGPPNLLLLFHAVAGTALVAVGASALNQFLEGKTDGQMLRTQDRPLPAGRLEPSTVLCFGVMTATIGLLYLAVAVNPLTGFLAVVTLGSYVGVYTPLKRRTTFNTLIGAIPGALPPVMGWAAATGEVGPEAGALFLILFFWQFPHFWAIAWMYKEDYARAGLKMVPVLDREGGRMTGRLMIQNCLALMVASMIPAALALAGPRYVIGALLMGMVFLASAVRFLAQPSRQRARHVLLASLLYLPIVLLMLLADGPLLIFPG